VDSPPVLILADATVLAAGADGVLLVVEAGRTRREGAEKAVESLRNVKARIVGVLINRAPTRGSGSYYYYYYYKDYGYGEKRPPKRGGGLGWLRGDKKRRHRSHRTEESVSWGQG
jgi:Mrp family chromosome partitioning ATPase